MRENLRRNGSATTLCRRSEHPSGTRRDADRQKRRSGTNSRRVFRKMSHAPYHSAKILFYFCATNFFRSAFSSLATRKNDASSPPSATTAKGRNSILWTSFKNKPTFRKNTTTFLTFSTGLKQEIITRRNNIPTEGEVPCAFRLSRAHYAHIHCFPILPSLLHQLFQHTNTQNITGEGFTLFCLHLPHPFSPSTPLHR